MRNLKPLQFKDIIFNMQPKGQGTPDYNVRAEQVEEREQTTTATKQSYQPSKLRITVTRVDESSDTDSILIARFSLDRTKIEMDLRKRLKIYTKTMGDKTWIRYLSLTYDANADEKALKRVREEELK